MTGKIIKGIAGFYYIHNGHDKVYACKAKGVFRNRGIKPVVGDNVEFTVLDETALEGNIDKILPRKNVLIRPASANVDQALVVFAITQPDPNFNLLDRFLIMMLAQDIPVTICFNKTDLENGAKQQEYRSIYEQAGYPVMFVSTYEKSGVEAVRDYLRGKTTILAGPSGVGKSSLTNLLQPEAAMETGSISEKIKRGRHTTRHSELFSIGNDTYLMDTPGFSSLYTNDFGKEELKYYFPEFDQYQGGCRFQGCNHISEPGCLVKEALEEGKVHQVRYEDYCEMYRELEQKEKRRY